MTKTVMDGNLLVTGASGFVGAYVRDAAEQGQFGNLRFVGMPKGLDLRDSPSVHSLIEETQPAAVVHLAAQSHVPRSFEDPAETLAVNVVGTSNLLDALRTQGFTGRLLYVSSGDIYGVVPESDLPVDESRMPEPRNPYAVSKWAAEQLCLMWHRARGLDVCIARPFNHVGPGQDTRFVLPALARQIVDIAEGRADPRIEVGDIDVTRDFSDVRDVVAAYAAIMAKGQAGAIYVIGSGQERRVRDLLGAMCDIENIVPEIHQDAARLRPAEQRRMVASSAKLAMQTGWTPKIPIEQTLHDILDNARKIHD